MREHEEREGVTVKKPLSILGRGVQKRTPFFALQTGQYKLV
jgi:hypothetical protein